MRKTLNEWDQPIEKITGEYNLALIYWVNNERKPRVHIKVWEMEFKQIADPVWYFPFYESVIQDMYKFSPAIVYYCWVEVDKPISEMRKSNYITTRYSPMDKW